ncbi:cell division control protein 6 homolog [Triticum dicoccoides]|uniref:cell division control protein 6 homolog n=1 Tax=Triticum dicoccoides TaxID=85692 RepID=UPI00188F0258|nr:cell division control protein 6 homolog [Triticum dicoccoides]
MAFLAILILVPELFVALARLIVADEIDYLITQERTVLHDLFMLTNHLFSKCMLIGIANAIDPADRFLPKLESLNCFSFFTADLISDNTTVLSYLQVIDIMYILIFFYTPVPLAYFLPSCQDII